jgi:signal transduction histidine kinase
VAITVANNVEGGDELIEGEVPNAPPEQRALEVINRFALRLFAISSEQELAWFVAREIVEELGFEDCVIYYANAAQSSLSQVAAIGVVKNPRANEIANALTIPFGAGITGTVAATVQPLLVNDLAEDDRYIADVNAARSELCVPIVGDGKVYGVIDCEHDEPGRFTPWHQRNLTSIAALTAARLRLLEADRNEKTLVLERHRAETANQAKTAFLSAMSHELRTPLNAILGFAQLLEMEDGNLSGEQRQSVGQIITGGQNLLTLVSDALDFAKIEQGKIDVSIESIDTDAIIDAALKSIKQFAVSRSITLVHNTADADVGPILGDFPRAKQVLLNFLSNAIKYNHLDGGVTISTTRLDEDGMARISVSDTGVGIPSHLQDKVFLPFERMGQEAAGIEGSGIGLGISKKLVELMGGRIGFTSTWGQGSTFWMDLPVSPDRPAS